MACNYIYETINYISEVKQNINLGWEKQNTFYLCDQAPALFVHPNFKILSRNEAYYECGASEKIDSLNINYQDYVTH